MSEVINRAQRRAMMKKKVNVYPISKVNEVGQSFLDYAEKWKVDLNAFFVMFAVWLKLPSAQKEAVIVKATREGLIKPEIEGASDAGKDSKGE